MRVYTRNLFQKNMQLSLYFILTTTFYLQCKLLGLRLHIKDDGNHLAAEGKKKIMRDQKTN